jgi:hypothetical protein
VAASLPGWSVKAGKEVRIRAGTRLSGQSFPHLKTFPL